MLFRLAATAFGPRLTGVILSGALDDGTAGLWAIKDHQGTALVQTPDEAMHASMPQSATPHVQVDSVGTVQALAAKVGELVGTAAPEANAQLALENHIAMEGNALKALIAKINEAMDKGLWATLRAVEEQVMPLRELVLDPAFFGHTSKG